MKSPHIFRVDEFWRILLYHLLEICTLTLIVVAWAAFGHREPEALAIPHRGDTEWLLSQRRSTREDSTRPLSLLEVGLQLEIPLPTKQVITRNILFLLAENHAFVVNIII